MRVRGNRFNIIYTPGKVLESLAVIAESAGLHGQSKIYVFLNGRRLELLDGFWGAVKAVARAVRYLEPPRFYRGFCGAERIVIKNNVIAFYPKHARIIKIFGDERAYLRHLQGLESFKKSYPGQIKSCDLIEHGSSPVFYVIESMLIGSKPEKPLNLSSHQIKDLASFHMRSSRIFVCDLSVGTAPSARGGHVLRSLGASEKYVIDMVFKRSSCSFVYGPVHGDLTSGNMLQVNGSLALLDWEGYAEGSISDDILTLWLQSDSETRELIIAEYNSAQRLRFCKDGAAAMPDEISTCLLIAMLFKLNNTGPLYQYLLARDGCTVEAEAGVSKYQSQLVEGVKWLCSRWNVYQGSGESPFSPLRLSQSGVQRPEPVQ